ncbi:hypothetical protein V2J09_012416 [Rumex salicifolius]
MRSGISQFLLSLIRLSFRRVHAKDCLAMEMSQDEHHQTNTCHIGSVAEYIEHGNGDSTVNCEIPTVEAGAIDACKSTSPVIGNSSDPLKRPTTSGNSNVIPEEGIKGCVFTKDDVFPASCKSPSSLPISEADPNCGTSREGNGFSVENTDKTEEMSVHHDDGDFNAHEITPVVNNYEDNHSKCLESIEGNVSGSSDTAAKILLSRERKRSKYLCYPFINLDKGSKVLLYSAESEIDDFKSPGNGYSSSLIKCSKRKRESRKSLTSSIKLEALTASSSELLMQLRMVALDHLSPYYDSSFDPTELLFNRFRESVFQGLSNSEVMGVADTQNDEAQRDEEDADFHAHGGKQNEVPVRKMLKKKGKTGSVDLYDVNVNFASESPLPVDPQIGSTPLSSKMKPQRKRKRKEEATMSPPVSPNINCTNGEPTEKIQQARGRGRPKCDLGQKKRMRKKETTPGISYINGNSVKPISLEVCLQDAGPYPIPNSAGFCGTEPKIPTPLPDILTPVKVNTTTSLETHEKSSAEVTIDQMKQSLMFMTAMLEKSATTISPEIRANLEIEIKNLLEKVNPVVSSSS